MKVFFIRHGESTANTLHVISNRDDGFPLTENGRRQAMELIPQIQSMGISKILCSTVLRAAETGEILSSALLLPIQMSSALREIDMGELEDQSSDAAWQEHDRIYSEWMGKGNLSAKARGGESLLDVQKRFLPFFQETTSEDGNNGNLLLISHGGLLISMLPLVLQNLTPEFCQTHHLSNTGIVAAERKADAFLCTRWEDVHFNFRGN